VDIYILRHGKAEDAGQDTSDADRRLTGKGREEIISAGRWIALQGIRFDVLASSPLARAQETAAIIADALGQKDRLVSWNELSPGGNTDGLFHALSKQRDARRILLVGHEPLLSAFISRIISGEENAAIALSKGGLAKIRGFTHSVRPSGELHWLLTAKQMAGLR
jgi:phosphohistidine phosphatase